MTPYTPTSKPPHTVTLERVTTTTVIQRATVEVTDEELDYVKSHLPDMAGKGWSSPLAMTFEYRATDMEKWAPSDLNDRTKTTTRVVLVNDSQPSQPTPRHGDVEPVDRADWKYKIRSIALPLITAAGLVLGQILAPAPAQAGGPDIYRAEVYKRAGDLMQDCEEGVPYTSGFCTGYITGAVDLAETMRHMRGERACVPDHVEIRMLRDAVRTFIERGAREGSGFLELPASVVVEAAIANTFCQGS